MAVEIRRIGAGEWRELRDLRLRALTDAPDAFTVTYEEESPRRGCALDGLGGGAGRGRLVVRAGRRAEGRWIGMAVGGPHRDFPGEAGLYAMWVDPSARGAGVARALVEGVVAWARSAGFPVIRLRVTVSNEAAVGLYVRCGFSDAGLRLPLREGSDIITMSMTMEL